MLTRRSALGLAAGLTAACGVQVPDPGTAAPLGAERVTIAAVSWHVDLCLPADAVKRGALAKLAGGAPQAAAFAFGFGLEAWMRAEHPDWRTGIGAVFGGPAVVSVRATDGAVPPGTEEQVALRLPAGGHQRIAAFIAGQIPGNPPPAPADGAVLLMPSTLPYSLDFTCNTWVMRALARAGLPVPVAGVTRRSTAMAMVLEEAARQAG
jgi:hypothetical protein